MGITVKGIKVRAEELNKHYTVAFNEINEAGQKRIFLEYKDMFFFDSITSRYESVRQLALSKKNECTSETIKNAIKTLIPSCSIVGVYDMDMVLELLGCRNFQLDESLREKLSRTQYWPVRAWVAKDAGTSTKMLNDMLVNEALSFSFYGTTMVLEPIILNPNFELLDKTKEILEKMSSSTYSKIINKIEELTKK